MSEYFDLHVQGLGYLNRIRQVKPKNGTSFWACDIAALHGATDNVNYTRFDCRVSGFNAIELVRQYQAAVEQDRKVLIGFRLGDLYADTFTYSKGERAGETGVSLKARLLSTSVGSRSMGRPSIRLTQHPNPARTRNRRQPR